ncbi:probable serine/threonine-protein kinase DDB_G0278509 [Mya arenaria]|uniref:probable serine/threonine-protein kinase DDB_G0278509 n=1 Tax=Mya arenaria TaxID=6604 RepID=UPI0022E88613|nr:probable serine/threonine-protein kinase DDB_G0278509 [Mya arenaria]
MYFFKLTLLLVNTLSMVSAVDEECIGQPPCYCSTFVLRNQSYYEMTCSNEGLLSIPKFDEIKVTNDALDIDLSKNNITVIGDSAFANFLVGGNTEIEIDLSSNRLQNITAAAFEGIAKNIVYLDISNNNLSALAGGLLELSSLQTLLANGNPVKILNDDLFKVVGESLTYFSVNMSFIVFWPESMQHLMSLKQLDLYGLRYTDIPVDAFDGFSESLLSLSLKKSYLPNIPQAVCSLKNMFQLDLEGSFIKNTTFICTSPLVSMIDLNMNECTLDRFPNMLASFPALKTLKIALNQIKDIAEVFIPMNHSLENLDMSFNRLQSIPYALTKFHLMVDLVLNFNNIMSVQIDDLKNFTSLIWLELNSNGILKISDDAFQNNINLDEINLSANNLTKIPSSVKTLSELKYLDLSFNDIKCTCSNFHLLKGWTVSNDLSLSGYCNQEKSSLELYINDRLPYCL